MRSAQFFRGFIGIFHYIQTSSVSGCYLPQRRLFLFYKVDPAFIKTILLLSALCRVSVSGLILSVGLPYSGFWSASFPDKFL